MSKHKRLKRRVRELKLRLDELEEDGFFELVAATKHCPILAKQRLNDLGTKAVDPNSETCSSFEPVGHLPDAEPMTPYPCIWSACQVRTPEHAGQLGVCDNRDCSSRRETVADLGKPLGLASGIEWCRHGLPPGVCQSCPCPCPPGGEDLSCEIHNETARQNAELVSLHDPEGITATTCDAAEVQDALGKGRVLAKLCRGLLKVAQPDYGPSVRLVPIDSDAWANLSAAITELLPEEKL